MSITEENYNESIAKNNVLNQLNQMLQITNVEAGDLPDTYGIKELYAISGSLLGLEPGYALDDRITELVHDTIVDFYTALQTGLGTLKTTVEGERDTLAGIAGS